MKGLPQAIRPKDRKLATQAQTWLAKEYVFRIPRSEVSDSTRLEMRGRYASFYYWFFQ